MPLALGGSPKQTPLESSSAIAAKKETWHSGARQRPHPSSRPPQSRQKRKLGTRGLAKAATPRVVLCNRCQKRKLGTQGLAKAAPPRVVLRNRGKKENLALGGSPKQPPLESSSAIAAKKKTW